MAVYVLVAAGMRDREEVGVSVVLTQCPDDGPLPDRLAYVRDRLAHQLVFEGVGGIGFELYRDRFMEDRMTETEEAGE
jgi:hypothetical protein